MKDILKIMRFDLLTAFPRASGIFIFGSVLFILLGLFLAPLVCAYVTFIAVAFVIPLQGIADKSGFNKLYGILPVARKNITRGRFLYIFLLHFTAELLGLAFAFLSMSLKLYRLLPNQNRETLQMIKNGFENTWQTLFVIFGMFTVFCLLFSYMEMMGQIFGRENEFKIIIITLLVITAVIAIFLFLSNNGVLPMMSLPSLPKTVSGMFILGGSVNAAMLCICMIFGEITAGRLAKCEL